ncbi:MAG: hypothetical protein EBT06_03955 [Gammaproteobacteria bacterium]|jgi:hypothetical protein|nr:hypothetical protein [Gammaproteobacteria bacterium]NBT44070.1 hypothetical protein [Gammaproteobacteria bacterium]NBY21361.1 hypothetical protein [Gammaproteobacteria bacterium]
MSREIVSAEYLNEWLTRNLRDIQDCDNCTISGVKKLQGTDEDGCNWSDTVMLNSAGSNEPYVRHKALDVVFQARRLFNLE